MVRHSTLGSTLNSETLLYRHTRIHMNCCLFWPAGKDVWSEMWMPSPFSFRPWNKPSQDVWIQQHVNVSIKGAITPNALCYWACFLLSTAVLSNNSFFPLKKSIYCDCKNWGRIPGLLGGGSQQRLLQRAYWAHWMVNNKSRAFFASIFSVSDTQYHSPSFVYVYEHTWRNLFELSFSNAFFPKFNLIITKGSGF